MSDRPMSGGWLTVGKNVAEEVVAACGFLGVVEHVLAVVSETIDEVSDFLPDLVVDGFVHQQLGGSQQR